MALTRAQLLSGNNSLGITLSGQTQGVTQGTGVIIAANGQISFDSTSAQGVMRLNNPGAYNAYVWPGTDGTSGTQLTTDGSGNLVWSASGTPAYTAKGQIEVGTGVGTSALQAVGANTSFLVADSSTATGLAYTSSLTSAVLLPAGNNTTNRPSPATVGQIRYNNTDNVFEGYSGSPASWQSIGGDMPTGAGGDKIFYLNSQNVTANYTLPTAPLAKNSVSAGPITIGGAVTVTVPVGQSWSIV